MSTLVRGSNIFFPISVACLLSHFSYLNFLIMMSKNHDLWPCDIDLFVRRAVLAENLYSNITFSACPKYLIRMSTV